METPGLSPRQVKILTAIQEGIRNNGYPPTLREIGQVAGLSSPASVRFRVPPSFRTADPYRIFTGKDGI